jgi:hypothetical protein
MWRNLNNSDTRQGFGVWAVFSLTSLKTYTHVSLMQQKSYKTLKNTSFVNTLSNSPSVLDRIKFLFCLVRSRPEMYLCLIIFYQAWLGSPILPASFTHSPATHGGEALFVLYIGTIGTRPIHSNWLSMWVTNYKILWSLSYVPTLQIFFIV